jgi:glutathione S-transferase
VTMTNTMKTTNTTPNIVLHQWAISPFCGKVRKVLELKGLSYRVVEYGGLRALKAKSVSPAGKLPVLDYDGERFQESSLIARMLDHRHPDPPLFPSSPAARHLAHLLEDWADESLFWFELWARVCDPIAEAKMVELVCLDRPAYERPLVKLGLRRYRRALHAQGLGRYSREHVLEQLLGHLEALDGRLAVDPWLAGDAPSIADIAVAAQLDEFVRTSPLASALDRFPRLVAWLARCRFGAGEQ